MTPNNLRRAVVAALFLFTFATAHAQVCPDIAGRYILRGLGDATNDARRVLGVHPGAPQGSAVQLEGDANEGLTVTVIGRADGGSPYLPVKLKNGSHYLCKDGRLDFTAALQARRETANGWYEGTSRVRVGRSGGGLDFDVTFTGSQSSTLYSYDSARIKVPIPFSGTILRDTLHWDGGPARAIVEAAPERRKIRDVRAMLDSRMLGPVMLDMLRESSDGVLATLGARTKDDIARLEDRLRAASIPYEIMAPPSWEGAGYYRLKLLIRPAESPTASASRPSVYVVEQELTRIRWPHVYVRKVEAAGDGFVATLGVQGADTVEKVISMFKKNTTLFADIRPLKESAPEAGSTTRVVQVQLLVR